MLGILIEHGRWKGRSRRLKVCLICPRIVPNLLDTPDLYESQVDHHIKDADLSLYYEPKLVEQTSVFSQGDQYLSPSEGPRLVEHTWGGDE